MSPYRCEMLHHHQSRILPTDPPSPVKQKSMQVLSMAVYAFYTGILPFIILIHTPLEVPQAVQSS